jgi:hypothetical protein
MNAITFEEAITLTESLVNQIRNQEIGEEEIEKNIADLVQTENGARGFFVVYLTGEDNTADNPSKAVINALASSPAIVSELLVKNLAMSTAMAITHRRNNDPVMAQSSEQVTGRTTNIIRQLKLDIIQEKLSQLTKSVANPTGEYHNFLERWRYDAEQKEAIVAQITSLISPM